MDRGNTIVNLKILTNQPDSFNFCYRNFYNQSSFSSLVPSNPFCSPPSSKRRTKRTRKQKSFQRKQGSSHGDTSNSSCGSPTIKPSPSPPPNRDGELHVATWNVFGSFQSEIKRPILIIELAKLVVENKLDLVFLQDTQIKNEEEDLLNRVERSILHEIKSQGLDTNIKLLSSFGFPNVGDQPGSSGGVMILITGVLSQLPVTLITDELKLGFFLGATFPTQPFPMTVFSAYMPHDVDGVVDLGYQSRINSLRPDVKLVPRTGRPAPQDRIRPFCWDLLSKKIKESIDNGSFVLLGMDANINLLKRRTKQNSHV